MPINPVTGVNQTERLRSNALTPPATDQGGFGREFRRSLRRGITEAGALGQEALAAGQAATGFEEAARENLEAAEQRRQEINASTPAPAIGRVEEIGSTGDFVGDVMSYLGQLSGSQVPVIGALAAAGLAGGVAGRAAGLRAATGSTLGVGAGSASIETGSIFGEIARDPEATGTLQDQAQISAVGGALAGSLDAIPFFQATRRLGVADPLGRSILARAARAAVPQAATEAATEAAQTLIERGTHHFVNRNFEVLGPEGASELLNAAVAGGILGGGLGAVSGALQRPGPTEEDLVGEIEAEEASNRVILEHRVQGLRGHVPDDVLDGFLAQPVVDDEMLNELDALAPDEFRQARSLERQNFFRARGEENPFQALALIKDGLEEGQADAGDYAVGLDILSGTLDRVLAGELPELSRREGSFMQEFLREGLLSQDDELVGLASDALAKLEDQGFASLEESGRATPEELAGLRERFDIGNLEGGPQGVESELRGVRERLQARGQLTPGLSSALDALQGELRASQETGVGSERASSSLEDFFKTSGLFEAQELEAGDVSPNGIPQSGIRSPLPRDEFLMSSSTGSFFVTPEKHNQNRAAKGLEPQNIDTPERTVEKLRKEFPDDEFQVIPARLLMEQKLMQAARSPQIVSARREFDEFLAGLRTEVDEETFQAQSEFLHRLSEDLAFRERIKGLIPAIDDSERQQRTAEMVDLAERVDLRTADFNPNSQIPQSEGFLPRARAEARIRGVELDLNDPLSVFDGTYAVQRIQPPTSVSSKRSNELGLSEDDLSGALSRKTRTERAFEKKGLGREPIDDDLAVLFTRMIRPPKRNDNGVVSVRLSKDDNLPIEFIIGVDGEPMAVSASYMTKVIARKLRRMRGLESTGELEYTPKEIVEAFAAGIGSLLTIPKANSEGFVDIDLPPSLSRNLVLMTKKDGTVVTTFGKVMEAFSGVNSKSAEQWTDFQEKLNSLRREEVEGELTRQEEQIALLTQAIRSKKIGVTQDDAGRSLSPEELAILSSQREALIENQEGNRQVSPRVEQVIADINEALRTGQMVVRGEVRALDRDDRAKLTARLGALRNNPQPLGTRARFLADFASVAAMMGQEGGGIRDRLGVVGVTSELDPDTGRPAVRSPDEQRELNRTVGSNVTTLRTNESRSRFDERIPVFERGDLRPFPDESDGDPVPLPEVGRERVPAPDLKTRDTRARPFASERKAALRIKDPVLRAKRLADLSVGVTERAGRANEVSDLEQAQLLRTQILDDLKSMLENSPKNDTKRAATQRTVIVQMIDRLIEESGRTIGTGPFRRPLGRRPVAGELLGPDGQIVLPETQGRSAAGEIREPRSLVESRRAINKIVDPVVRNRMLAELERGASTEASAPAPPPSPSSPFAPARTQDGELIVTQDLRAVLSEDFARLNREFEEEEITSYTPNPFSRLFDVAQKIQQEGLVSPQAADESNSEFFYRTMQADPFLRRQIPEGLIPPPRLVGPVNRRNEAFAQKKALIDQLAEEDRLREVDERRGAIRIVRDEPSTDTPRETLKQKVARKKAEREVAERRAGIRLADAFVSAQDAARMGDLSMESAETRILDQLLLFDSDTHNEQFRRLADIGLRWARRAGVDQGHRLLTTTDVISILKRRGDVTRLQEIAAGNLMGLTIGESVWVSPFVDLAAQKELLAHEMGHAIAHATQPANFDPVYNAWKKWRRDVKQRGATPAEARRTVQLALENMGNNTALTMAELSQTDREYVLDFEEWFADQAASWLASQDAKASTSTDRWFTRFVTKIGTLFADAKQEAAITDESVAHFLERTVRTNAHAAGVVRWHGIRDARAPAAAVVEDPTTQYANQALRAMLMNGWLGGDAANILIRAFTKDTSVTRQIQNLVRPFSASEAAQIGRDPVKAAAYGFQFWTEGKLDIGPKVENTFTKWRDRIFRALGEVTEFEQVDEILPQVKEAIEAAQAVGTDSILQDLSEVMKTGQHSSWTVTRAIKDTRMQKIAQANKEVWGKYLSRFASSIFLPAVDQMEQTGNAFLVELARRFHTPPGTQGSEESYLQGRSTQFGVWQDRMARSLGEDVSQELSDEVMAARQQNVEPKGARAKEVVGKLRSAFADMYDYAIRNNLPMGQRQDYFPWVYDIEQLASRKDEFIEMMLLPEYRAAMEDILQTAEDIDTVEELAEYYHNALTNNDGYADVKLETNRTGHIPFVAALNSRGLNFLQALGSKKGKDLHASFLSKDLNQVLRTYTEQLVKRAEFTRVFGSPDSNGRTEVDTLLRRAQRTGATPQQMKLADKFVDAMQGTLGAETNSWVTKVLTGENAPAGQIINPKLQSTFSAAVLWQNLRVLPLAAFTSLADPVGILVRGGSMDVALASLEAGFADSYSAKVAQGLGIIDTYTIDQALASTYGTNYMTGRTRLWNERFFSAIGLTTLTRVTRSMATGAALEFLRKHAFDPGASSKRFLDELNLEAGDVKLNEDGEIMVLHRREIDALYDAKTPEATAEIDRDKRVRTAIRRFVDESILRPNAATRPIWGSDPHLQLVIHLKSFMFTFHSMILRRVWNEAKQGNYAPVLFLTVFVPVMIAADLARDWARFGFGGDPAKEGWGTLDWLQDGMVRSGIPGLGLLLIDAKQDRNFGGVGLESFLGPTADSLRDVDDLLLNEGQGRWQAIVDQLPGQNTVAVDWLR